MKNDLNFYKDISKSNLSLTALLKNEKLFFAVPKYWSVVVTDIKNSTRAIEEGFHHDVNLTAAGSIITVLNTIKLIDPKIKIPYFFGGDGSTFILPNSLLDTVLLALENYRTHVKNTLNLILRVGHLEVEKIYANNVSLKISKIRHNQYLTTPVILGNGLKFAEQTIKDSFVVKGESTKDNSKPNLEGMECRWDEIYPNSADKKVICLLVDCNDEASQAQVYGTLMEEIDSIFGTLEKRNPISSLKLKLNTSLSKIRTEMYMKLGEYQRLYLITNWLLTLMGSYYFRFFKSGKLYTHRVTQLSDTIMLDGFLNTVISGTEEQVNRLKRYLDSLEIENKITYGMHITHASIMSCYIEDRVEKHIHFVDGTDGGYTSAARIFKEKFKLLKLRNP